MKTHHFIKYAALLLVCCAMLGCGKENDGSSGDECSSRGFIYGLPISFN